MKLSAALFLSVSSILVMACGVAPDGSIEDGLAADSDDLEGTADSNASEVAGDDLTANEDGPRANPRPVQSDPDAFQVIAGEESFASPQAKVAGDSDGASPACAVGKSCTFCGPDVNQCYYFSHTGTRYKGTVKLSGTSCICESPGSYFDWSCDASCGMY